MSNGIYSLIPEQRLNSILETLHSYTDLQVQLISSDGQVLCRFGNTTAYCTTLNAHLFSANECTKLHADAGKKAQSLGEAYIFTCHAELNHIAFPLLHRKDLLGTIIVGPFLMDAPDSTFVGALVDKYPISPALALILYDRLSKLPVIPPARVNYLKKLLDHLFSPLLPAEQILLLQAQKNAYQKARVNETIQIYKDEASSADGNSYYEKEKSLLGKVRSGDLEGAKNLLDQLIAYIHYAEGAKADTMRMHTQSLLSALALAAVDGGAAPNLIFTLQKHYFLRLQAEKTADRLSFCLQEALESFISEILSGTDNGNTHIRAALRYMTKHYSHPLTLESVAAEVGLSPNYFSSLFRKTTGISFREQLCRIRIEESKRLLLSTDYSLTDIAVAMGFNDQSYYCKVFKRITGLTPGRYKNK